MASPLICSSFDPSARYFAYGIVSLDTHDVRVVAVHPSQSSLNTSFKLDKSSSLTGITWVPFGDNYVLALSLTRGSVLIYSPLNNEVIAELQTPDKSSIRDFHYSVLTKSAWCCDIGGSIFEWDIIGFKLLQTFKVSDISDTLEYFEKITTIEYDGKPHLLAGSYSVQLIDINTKQVVKSFPGHVEPLNTLLPVEGHSDLFVTGATNDRFVNLYSISKNAPKSVFNSLSPINRATLGSNGGKYVLVTINEDGQLDIYNDILEDQQYQTSGVKRHRKQNNVNSRSKSSQIRLTRPKDEIKNFSDETLPVVSLMVNNDRILFTWLESNAPYFEEVKWLNDDIYELEGDKVIEKARPVSKVAHHSSNGHDVAATKHYNEANAVVREGISMNDEEDDGESLADKLEKLNSTQTKPKRRNDGRNITSSLAVILSQSLKNNDNSLLETVLNNRDPQVITETISRIEPSQVVILLEKISEKIQRQSTRFDQLNYWLKWILIIHGGVLSTFLRSSGELVHLHAILSKKAKTLPTLLELEGRLSLLSHQRELKHDILGGEEEDSSETESDIEYIEELDDEVNGDVDMEDVSGDENGVLEDEVDEEEEEDEEQDDDEGDEEGEEEESD